MPLMKSVVRASIPCINKAPSGTKSIAQGPRFLSNQTASSPASLQYSAARATKPHARRWSAMAAARPEYAALLDELANFRALFDSVPFVSKQPRVSAPREFSFTTGTMFKAPNPDVGVSMAPAYGRSLAEHGITAIQLGFADPDSKFILSIVAAMGCQPDTHSSSHGALWDIKYKPEGVKSEATGKTAHSISHSLGEFSWHTDGAFETNPTRFFGFHILHPDRQGGGVFRVLSGEDLIQELSDEAIQTLMHHEYDLKVPDEFFKGERTVKGKILDIDKTTGRVYVRYRRDILMDPPSADPQACKAVEELKALLSDPEDESVGEVIPDFAFKENTVLLMDNARFLHSRTKIKDPKRWLRRVRFHGTPGGPHGTDEAWSNLQHNFLIE